MVHTDSRSRRRDVSGDVTTIKFWTVNISKTKLGHNIEDVCDESYGHITDDVRGPHDVIMKTS